MHRVGAAVQTGLHHPLDVEITGRSLCRPEQHRLVGQTYVQRVAVGLGVHRDAGHPEPAAGVYHPTGDLAAVGDQDFAKHAHSGRLPCLRHGLLSFLSASIARARHSRRRVLCGRITSSI